MKNQALFSSKDKSKSIRMSSAAILLGALRVNVFLIIYVGISVHMSTFKEDRFT